MKEQIKINRQYFLLCVLVTFSAFLIDYLVGTVFATIDHQIVFNNPNSYEARSESSLNSLSVVMGGGIIATILIPVLSVIYFEASEKDEKATDQIIYKNQLPEIEKLSTMNCIMCDGKIHQPMNLIKHLGIDQTRKYLMFCDESKTAPSLYCCQCYDIVERQPNWQKSMDEMIENAIQYGNLKKKLEEKISSLNHV